MFSQEVGGFTWRWEGIMDAFKINVHKKFFKKFFPKINFYDFFLKKYGLGSESGFSKAWIRLHNNGFWRKKLISKEIEKLTSKTVFAA
jgi:hypothetical protein